MHEENDDLDQNIGPSKTQIKKEMLALQALGAEICRLNREQQTKIPMDDVLREVVEQAPKIKGNSARKRHMQYLGKLLRSADAVKIHEALEALRESSHRQTRQLHLVERWRDDLIEKPEALADFIEQFSMTDRQQLRQLVRAAQKDKSKNKNPGSARKLFRFIRDELAAESN